jgi:amino acid permease
MNISKKEKGLHQGESTMTTDFLIPEFDSVKRQSSIVVAIFNLSATIVGGGVLSLPLAFSKCGIILGTLLMVIAAITTERSLYLVCICARITGATSYGEVGKVAFGKYMEYFISLLLSIFLMFVLVGYMVLLEDIWSPIVEIILGMDTAPDSQWVLLALVLLMSPFLIQKSLHSLRYNCYVGFASVSLLCFALCRRAIVSPIPTPFLLWSTSYGDILFAFPIFILSFLSVFNVLSIQGSLIRPSRVRILGVIDGAVTCCFVLMQLFGLAGYFLAGNQTNGNILINADIHSDWMFFLGRLGCGITIMLAMAMMLLPCRSSLLEVVDVFLYGPHIVPVEVAEQIPLLHSTTNNGNDKNQPTSLSESFNITTHRPTLLDNSVAHYAATIGIVVLCYVVAVRVPGVAFVWSLCGSFMSFLIAFILPAACYLEIHRSHAAAASSESPAWVGFSWFLIISSVLASIACTVHTVTSLV